MITPMYGKNVGRQTPTALSNVQLKRFKLAANGITAWTSWSPAPCVFADKNVYTILTQAADALGACITVPQYG
jgi:hypothetical protein